jgi:chromosome segregation ATPase
MASKQKEVYGSYDPSREDALDLNEITDEEEKNYGRQITSLSNDKVMARINKKGDEAIAAIQAKIDSVKSERDKKRAQKNEEVELEEGQYKELDTRKGDLKLAKDKKQALKDKYNAIMAGQASGDENSIADQIQKLDMSIKKQEQELIDIMKKQKETKKEEVETVEEAAGPNRLTNLNDKITKLQVNLSKLDKSKPESKTKEAIMKADLVTAKLRLQDVIQKRNAETKQESVNEAKKNYKSMKKSVKKEQDKEVNSKRTLTDKPITKVDVDPKIQN